jgi:hypothetical protein
MDGRLGADRVRHLLRRCRVARAGIGFFDFATGKVQRVVDFPGRPEPFGGGLAVSPDGRSVLFSQRDEVPNDIMLVENFDLP